VNQFNHVFHRRPVHIGVINGAVWSAHSRGLAHSVVSNTTSNHRTIMKENGMTNARVLTPMVELTNNPHNPFAVNANHRDCFGDIEGGFWWDNGYLCPIQGHEDH